MDSIAMQGRRIVVPAEWQDKAQKQMHLYHIGIETTRLLAHESIYWVNMNADV